MKKPSANERADASRLVTGARSHCLSANHLAREGQVGEGVNPTPNVVRIIAVVLKENGKKIYYLTR